MNRNWLLSLANKCFWWQSGSFKVFLMWFVLNFVVAVFRFSHMHWEQRLIKLGSHIFNLLTSYFVSIAMLNAYINGLTLTSTDDRRWNNTNHDYIDVWLQQYMLLSIGHISNFAMWPNSLFAVRCSHLFRFSSFILAFFAKLNHSASL